MESLEKYYCDQCRLLYDHEEKCKICGDVAFKKIKIEVQNQKEKE